MQYFSHYFVQALSMSQVWLCSAILTVGFIGFAEAWLKFKTVYASKISARAAVQNN